MDKSYYRQEIRNALHPLLDHYLSCLTPKGIGEYELPDLEGYWYVINLISAILTLIKEDTPEEKKI